MQSENAAPSINAPSTQTDSLNSDVAFSSNDDSAISVTAPGASENQPIEVTLSVDQGILTLGNTNGLSFTNGDGFQDATMTFTGSLANINAALEGMNFIPTTVDFLGTANLQITVNNQAPAFADGGPKTTTATVAINVSMPSDYSGLLATYYNNSDGIDLALGKNATESSDPFGYPASNAVDGDLTDFSHTDCNTGAKPNEWWQVDLSPGTNTQLNLIQVYNRADGCGERLQNFTISVIAADGTTVWSQVYNQPTYTAEELDFNTGNISGEFVRIQKNDANYLHLAEVEVFNVVPAVTRIDPTVNFNWGNQGSPAPGISGTDWTASWQGEVKADYTGDYTFYATARRRRPRCGSTISWYVTVGHTRAPPTYSGTIDLTPGSRTRSAWTISRAAGEKSAKLEWSCNDGQGNTLLSRQIIPPQQPQLREPNPAAENAPVNSVPGEQTLGINSPLIFSSAHGNAISISDPDAEADSTSVSVANSNFESPTGS